MALVGKFQLRHGCQLVERDRCILGTERGRELGEVLRKPRQLEEGTSLAGEILRKATPEDLQLAERIEDHQRPYEMNFCKQNIEALQLPIKLIEVDHLIGGERIIFYFISETRIDFRELVKILAREFKTRIEMQQIGVRDRARLTGTIGHCGLPLCCKGFLHDLGGITVDMAKLQKHTTDPAKVTGRCGKLLCCLKYEHEFYEEMRGLLPPKGSKISTSKGEGMVIDHNPLLRQVTIEKESGLRLTVNLNDILGQ
jgi:cell fate regulator YaaT (PSP1 superfamily)